MHQVCMVLSKLQKQTLKILTSWIFFKKYTFEYVLQQQQQKRRLYKEPAIYP